MYEFLWCLTGFLFTCGVLLVVAITETNSKVEVSWITIVILIVGTAGGYITAFIMSFFGMMMLLDHKPFRKRITKPFKTFNLKKDKE